ncbi:MAG: DNA-primase RepB domain-containing protein [Phycisphaerales bacterium]
MNDLKTYVDLIYAEDDIIEIRFIWPKNVPGGSQPHSIWCLAKDLLEHQQEMTSMNEQGWGVYCGVNPRKGFNLRGDKNVTLARTIFCDFDDKDSDVHGIYPGEGCGRNEFLYWLLSDKGLSYPTLIINSGHGLHAYWRLSEPLTDLKKWEQIQQKLIITLHSDRTIKNPERIMRLPGFKNTKRKPYLDACIIDGGPNV